MHLFDGRKGSIKLILTKKENVNRSNSSMKLVDFIIYKNIHSRLFWIIFCLLNYIIVILMSIKRPNVISRSITTILLEICVCQDQ